MKYINNDRRNYIFINQEKFLESKDLNSYLRDWVANYEISDYFRNYEDNKNIYGFLGMLAMIIQMKCLN